MTMTNAQEEDVSESDPKRHGYAKSAREAGFRSGRKRRPSRSKQYGRLAWHRDCHASVARIDCHVK